MFRSFVGKFGGVAEFCIFTHYPRFIAQCDPQTCRAGRKEPRLARLRNAGSVWNWCDFTLPRGAPRGAGSPAGEVPWGAAGHRDVAQSPGGCSGTGFIPRNVRRGCATELLVPEPGPAAVASRGNKAAGARGSLGVPALPVQVITGHALLLPGTEPVVV